MGKRLIQQKAGRGSSRYTANSHRYKGKTKIPNLDKPTTAIVQDIIHCPGHNAPLALLLFKDGYKTLIGAHESMSVNSEISYGEQTEIKPGNIANLENIPIGTDVYNIERTPGDGGKFIKTAGVSGKIVAKQENNKILIIMPSKKQKLFNSKCKAIIGILAGGGRNQKPFVKAGKRWHIRRARGKLFPRTSAVAMNPCNHPFGSGRGRHPGKSTIAPRFAPPGRKVGLLKPKRTGRKR